ncbi:MAG: sensor histidine kinase [Lachnospiraceae bacterium]
MKQKHLSFGRKLMMTYIILIVIVSIGFVLEIGQNIYYIFNSHITYLRQYNAQVSLSLDSIMAVEEQLQHLYLMDTKTEEIFFLEQNVSKEKAEENRQYLRDILMILTNVNPYVLRITIKLDDGRIYSSLNDDLTSYVEECDARSVNADWSDKTKKYYTDAYPCEIYQVQYQIVTSICKIYGIDGTSCWGTIYVDLNWEEIQNQFMRTFIEDTDSGFLLLTEDSIMISSRENHVEANGGVADLLGRTEALFSGERDHLFLYYNNTNYLITGLQNEETGWYVLGFISMDMILLKCLQNMGGTFLWSVIIFVIVVIIAKLLSEQISRPIVMLSNVMSSSVKGKVELFTQPNIWHDEIGDLIESYNLMGKRMNDTIQRVYIHELNQKQAELRMLQYQINPHFLYNALNTISSIARLEEVEYIPELVDSLADMFRYSIKGDNFGSIDEELKQVDNYFNILKIRFPERYEIEYDVQEDLHTYGILKLTIQPLVENAVCHAFVQVRKKDYVKITVCEESMDRIEISVYDNGVGMPKEIVERLNQNLLNMSSDEMMANPIEGIGLNNVNARLKNYYGEDCHLYVDSKEGEYTKVSFKVKKIKMEVHGGVYSEKGNNSGR